MLEAAFARALEDLIDCLEAVGVPYAVTGSVASGIHGRPLTSIDVDLIVEMTQGQARALAEKLPAHFYRSEAAMVQACQAPGIANVIDQRSSLKIDLSVMEPGPFRKSIMSRVQTVELGSTGLSLRVVSAEDVILMKLLWRKGSQSRKQWENALDVVRVQGARLDWAYLHRWAEKLKLAEDLDALRNEAGV